MCSRPIILVASTAVALLATTAVIAADLEVDWWTVDGGGAKLDGGTYTLMGTAGQPDAGPALGGGAYALIGGFWGGEAQYGVYLPLILLGQG